MKLKIKKSVLKQAIRKSMLKQQVSSNAKRIYELVQLRFWHAYESPNQNNTKQFVIKYVQKKMKNKKLSSLLLKRFKAASLVIPDGSDQSDFVLDYIQQAIKKSTSKQSSTVDLTPGVVMKLIPTGDGQGHRINISGSFRSGGMSTQEISSKLQRIFSQMNID